MPMSASVAAVSSYSIVNGSVKGSVPLVRLMKAGGEFSTISFSPQVP